MGVLGHMQALKPLVPTVLNNDNLNSLQPAVVTADAHDNDLTRCALDWQHRTLDWQHHAGEWAGRQRVGSEQQRGED